MTTSTPLDIINDLETYLGEHSMLHAGLCSIGVQACWFMESRTCDTLYPGQTETSPAW